MQDLIGCSWLALFQIFFSGNDEVICSGKPDILPIVNYWLLIEINIKSVLDEFPIRARHPIHSKERFITK